VNVSGVIDTLIVLIAIYVGGAVACSFVNETIAALVQLRGRALYKGLVNLIAGREDIVKALYDHPLIAAGSADDGKKSRPSYLDARTFSTAFWQQIHQTLSGGTAGAAAEALVASPNTFVADLQARLQLIDDKSADPKLRDLKVTLLTLLQKAGGDYTALLTATDSWFNAQMDRVGGWYKRQVQWIVLAIGVLLAFCLNVDTIHIATRLSEDSALRAVTADQLQAQYKKTEALHGTAADQPGAFTQNLDTALANSQIPLDAFVVTDPHMLFRASFANWSTILGTLITALALALGAPFWFDVLSMLLKLNVRMAGQKPAS